MISTDEKILQNRLIKKFHLIFWSGVGIIFAVFMVAFITFVIILKKEWLFLVCLPIIIFMLWQAIPYFKDFNAIKTKSFKKVEGRLIEYKKFQNGASFTAKWFYFPIIEDETTKEKVELELDVGQYASKGVKKPETVGIGKKYLCLYLENSRLAVCKNIDIQESNTDQM